MSQLVQQNETSGVLRRLYFYLVDAANGITPVPGVTGSPEVSRNGDVWNNNIGLLVEIGNGHYYAEVDSSEFTGTEAIIVGRFATGGVAEAPSLNMLQVVEWDPQATPKVTNDRVGGFAGAGDNTIFGFFKALFKKDAALPSNIGGTYDEATDSQEALRERLDAMAGSGFSTSEHSLVQIAAGHGSEGSISGAGASGTGSLNPVGWLSRVVSVVRRTTDEPEINAKYSVNELIGLIRVQWVSLWSDLKLTADSPAVVRYDVTVVADTQEYFLPGPMGEIIRISKVIANTGLAEWELYPQSMYSPWGPGFTIEGNILRLTPIWKEGHTVRLEYVPSGDVAFHEGSGEVLTATTFQLDLDPAPGSPSTTRVGTLDGRENAYAGMMMRILAGGVNNRIIERMITSYDEGSAIVTLTTDQGGLTSGTFDYEIVPWFGTDLEHVLGLSAGRTILMREGNKERYQIVTQEYKEKLRNLRIRFRDRQTRRATHAEGDVNDNSRFSTGAPFLFGR